MNASKKINFLLTTKNHLCFFVFTLATTKQKPEGESEVELGVIIPFVKNRIITPIQAETVGRSPCFIGSLVSSIATIIADTTLYLCSYLPKLFTITNPFQVLPPNTLLLL